MLVIDGVTYTSGEFGALLSGAANETDAITGSGRLNVVAVAVLDYDAWVTSFQPGFTNNLPAQDQDGDGLTNRQEYAFGLNPKSGASVNPITAQLSRATGMFTYTRRVPALATPNLTYVVQTSSTLAAWANDNTAVQTVIGTVGDVQTVEVKLTGSLPLAANPLFVRIKSE